MTPCPHPKYTVEGTETYRNLSTGEVHYREWRRCLLCREIVIVRVQELRR